MSDAAQTLMTVDEFLATADEREGAWEIENGVAFAMAPERLDHARVMAGAFITLRDAIRRARLSCEAVTDSVAVRITARTAHRPDALVYGGPRLPAEAREFPAPIIVVEALSDSTARRDVHRKLIGYFSLDSVAHYLILEPRDRALIHHKRAGDGLSETRVLSDGPLRLDPPGLDLAVADLFGEV